MKIPFSPPYITKDIVKEVTDTLESGWITTGPKTKLFEEEICEFTGAKRCHCVNSATSGLLLALKWYGIGDGDEVIIPAYTYSATALAVIHCGAKPVMVDINEEDFNISVNAIEKAITSNTKAIIPVDIGGLPCDYDQIFDLVSKVEIKKSFTPSNEKQNKLGRILVVSDAAHSFGALYTNNKIGSLPDFSIFSFHAVKNLTTGEGGAICMNFVDFDNDEVHQELSLMSLNGQTKSALSKSEGGGWKYDIVLPGYKANMPDICASIGLAQLRIYENILLKREFVFDLYIKLLSQYDWAILPNRVNELKKSSCHLFQLRIRNITETQRDLIIKEISDNNVGVNVHFIPLPVLTLFQSDYNILDFPYTYEKYQNEISLPIYPQLLENEVEHVVEVLANAYKVIVDEKKLQIS